LGFEEGVDLGDLLTFGDGTLDVSRLLVSVIGDSGESLLGLVDGSNLMRSGKMGEEKWFKSIVEMSMSTRVRRIE